MKNSLILHHRVAETIENPSLGALGDAVVQIFIPTGRSWNWELDIALDYQALNAFL